MITLKSKDVEVELLPIGASIYQIKTKNKDGVFKNICLSPESEKEFESKKEYFGTTVGRFAGRIREAKFVIDNEEYFLEKNFKDKHNLHGGTSGLSFSLWEYEVITNEDESKCIFTKSSKHLEGGFPANVDIKVEYILKNNCLTINFYGTSDRRTYLNLTNHSYFNLSDGEEENIEDHLIQLNATKYLPCDSDVIPIGIEEVKGTEYDLTTLKPFGELSNMQDDILKEFKGFDNCFVLDKDDKKLPYDLYLKDEKSGRSLKIETTYPSLVMYTYNFLSDINFIGRKNIPHIGVAIEPQYAPNSVNDDRLYIPIIDKDRPYFETIKYTFN